MRTFAVLTTPANELVGTIHDRMPAVLARVDYDRWLGTELDPRDLLQPFPSDLMAIWPISTRVNSPSNDDEHLLECLCLPMQEVSNVPSLDFKRGLETHIRPAKC